VVDLLRAIPGTLLALGAGTLLLVIAVLLPGKGREPRMAARIAGGMLAALALVAPFVLRSPPLFKALLGNCMAVECWRVFEILRTPGSFSRRERVLRVLLVPYEFTFLERTPRRWPLARLAWSSAVLVVGIAVLVFSSRLSPPVPPYALAGWPRWIGAAMGAYAIMEGATAQWVAVLPVFGWHHRPYQRHPILSRTFAEFWGVRWSSVVHEWLRSNVYQPLARRGFPRTGVVAAFGVSALLHGYLVWPAAGLVAASWMLGFFLAQGALMVLEARLRVRRWRPAAGRIFVVAGFVLTIPLFVEPFLRAIGL
jgi:hypothetical protein